MKVLKTYILVISIVYGATLNGQTVDSERLQKWDLDSLYFRAFDLSGSISEEAWQESILFMEVCKQLKDSVYLPYACDIFASNCFQRNYIDSAFAFADSAINMYRAINDSVGLSLALYNKSLYYEYLGQYATCLRLIHLSREIDIKLGEKLENDIFYYHRLSSIVYAQDQVELALRYAHKAWAAMQKAGMPYDYLLPEFHLNYAWLYSELEQGELAEYHAKKAYALTKSDSLRISRSGALEVLAEEAFRKGDSMEAIHYAQQALKLCEDYGDRYYLIYNYFFQVDFYSRLDDKQKASFYANLVKENSDKYKESPSYVWSVNNTLYQYYKMQGNNKEALVYLERRIETQDRINKYDGRAAIKQFDKEMAERSQKLNQVKAKLKEQQLAAQEKIIYLAIILLVIASIFIFLMYKSRRRLKSMNLTLKSRNELVIKQKEKIQKQKQSLESRNRELNELNSSKDRLFSILAHDLRQPFNQILGIVDLVQSQSLNKEEKGELTKDLKASVQATSDLVNNVLLWSKAQFAGITVKQVNLPLAETVKKALLYFSVALTKKEIKVNFEIDDRLQICFDRDHFESVMRNIVSNAYKFSPAGATIRIVASPNLANKRVLLRIIDEGRGMDQLQREKLLKGTGAGDTYQGTFQENGTGIGMIIVRDFLKENNAGFNIESSLGEGTTVILDLPLCTA